MRFLVAMLLIAIFAGCLQPTEGSSFGPPVVKMESSNCSGLIEFVAVDATSLNLPPLNLLAAGEIFDDPTHADVLMLMGLECDGWSESGSGVLLQGEGWTAYPLHQFGNGPFSQERHEANWLMGNGTSQTMSLPIPIEYDVTTGYDSQSRWFDLTRLQANVSVESIDFTFIRENAALRLSWEGETALGLADCLVRDGSIEADVLGPLDCDTHSSLALNLNQVPLISEWNQFVAQTI